VSLRFDWERAARTESLFREVNERIAETADRFEAGEAQFVCECADPACTERIVAELDDYEDVRGDGARFMVANGHCDERIEQVVDEKGPYDVVEKDHPKVEPIVRDLDPRQ
jgi:hypothetical protein